MDNTVIRARKWLRVGLGLWLLVFAVQACSPTTGPVEGDSAPMNPTPEADFSPTGAAATALPPAATPTVESRPTEEVMPDPTITAQALPESNPFIERARQDLAQRLSIDPSEILLVSMEQMVWPDKGLGCPQPGMVYQQVPQDGYRIILQAGKVEYAYHGGGVRDPFLCENEAGGELSPPPGLGSE